jgi:hypothetical protein
MTASTPVGEERLNLTASLCEGECLAIGKALVGRFGRTFRIELEDATLRITADGTCHVQPRWPDVAVIKIDRVGQAQHVSVASPD